MIGREDEIERLENSLITDKSELIAVYGRRRVGKTFLIRNVYKKHIKFEFTGLARATTKAQLKRFHKVIKSSSKRMSKVKLPADWGDAFDLLEKYIDGLTGKGKKVIFIDELPWLDKRQSKFLSHFGYFWNTFCEKRNDLIVVVCGSAAAYMVNNVIKDKGSLHGRLSYRLPITPFNLYEVKEYLEKEKKINYWGDYDILQLYIALGGVPKYLSFVDKRFSVVQNIQRICFDPRGDLINEFNEVYASLFGNPHRYIEIVKVLAKSRYGGITRQEISQLSNQGTGGNLTKALENLEASGFITAYPEYSKRNKTLYRLADEFSRFYLKYMEPNKKQSADFWLTTSSKQTFVTWAGISFETICLKHVEQIKKALNVFGVGSRNSSWSIKGTKAARGAQIDLVIDRNDNWINLCEMKFFNNKFNYTKSVDDNIKNKEKQFRSATKTNKATAIVFISTHGVKNENVYFTNTVSNNLTMKVLFEKV